MTAQIIQFPGRYHPWLTKKQLATALGVSVRKVEYWLADGCPSRLTKGRREFRLSDVQQWLDGEAKEASNGFDRPA